MGKLILISEWVYKFIALNFLWFLFFLMGLGIFGFMPATVALFSVIRKWLMGEKEIPLFSTFFHYFKGEFVRSNFIGAMFLVVFYIIYVNFQFVSFYYDEGIQFYIYFIVLSFGSLAIMTFINTFSIMAHFEYSTLKYVKAALGLVFLHPVKTFMQILWIMAYVIIAINYPRIFIIIGVSVFSFILMTMNYMTFKKYDTVS